MKFKLDIPNERSFGKLKFTAPDKMESAIWFRDFEQYCRKRAKEEFGEYSAITERLDKELKLISDMDAVFYFEILEEIAKFSNGMGYPVALEGEESGLLIMYLLGVSGIHPGKYEFSTTPTDLYIESVKKNGEMSFSLGFANPIRELIVPHLQEEFGEIKSDDNCFLEISLSEWTMLETVGKLSSLTGVHYSLVPIEEYLLSAVQWWDICDKDLKWERENEYTPVTALSVAKHYAFARCNSNIGKSRNVFSDVNKYVLKDDMFKVLTECGIPSDKAYILSRNWLSDDEKEKEVSLLKENGVPENAIYVFKVLHNQWSAATCLSRINFLAILRYYNFNYPDEYGRIVSDIDYERYGIIPTNFKKLNEILKGGFRKGDLCLIGARPAVGKTTFAIQLADYIADGYKKVVFFSLESTKRQIEEILYKHGTAAPLMEIDESPAIDTKHIKKKLIETEADVAVIDYLGLIKPSEKKDNRVEEFSDIAYELRSIAEELNVAIIVTMQLSRKYGIQINELKHHCALEGLDFSDQDANTILFLNRDDYYNEDDDIGSNDAQIIVAKNMYGNIGTIDATFDSEKRLFKEV